MCYAQWACTALSVEFLSPSNHKLLLPDRDKSAAVETLPSVDGSKFCEGSANQKEQVLVRNPACRPDVSIDNRTSLV